MSTISFDAVDEARQYEQARERKGDEDIWREGEKTASPLVCSGGLRSTTARVVFVNPKP